jgi:hypothetical protein
VNTPPTIAIPSNALDITLLPGASSPVIPITVGDAPNETPAASLVLSFSSSNPALVANTPSSFQQTGSGANRGVIVTPVANAFGSTVITATVTDTGKADGTDVKSTSATFKITVSAGQNPTISAISDVTTHVNTDTDIINFTVNDAQTPAASLIVTATSDNQVVAPDTNIQFGGSGSSRALIIRPGANQAGVANISVKVKDTDNNTATTTFKLTVLGSPPTITSVTDQLIQVGGSTGPLPFTVGSATTFPGFLVVTASSSNKTFVPDTNVLLGGSNASRTVTVVGAAQQAGTTTITLSVQDSQGQIVSTTFKVSTPQTANTPPTISKISDVSVQVGTPIPIITFTVGDAETAVGDLRVGATASNANLIPASGIFLGGSGATRTMLVTPAKGQTGSSLMVVTVTDGGGASASTSFNIAISSTPPVNVPNDFNGDGVPDIILQDAGGNLAAWLMSGDDLLQGVFLSPSTTGDPAWKVIASADFNGDGKPDLLLQYKDGTLAVWYMNGTTLVSSAFVNPSNTGNPDWHAVAVADFNKDGHPDILLQNTDGTLAVWYMNGITLNTVAPLVPASSGSVWHAVTAADFNNDGNIDIIFQHDDGTIAVWYLKNGTNLLLAALINPSFPGSADWRVVGSTELNGDGKPDLLLQNRATHDIAIWYMNGPNLILGKLLTPSNPGGTWSVVAP